jgi:surface antigen
LPAKPPSFDRDVLAPLQAKQAEEAAIAAAAAEAARQARIAAIAGRVQPNGTYGNNYAFGNCTAYVASRVAVPNSMGNANAWGYALAAHSRPEVGAIAWTTAGWAGHVALVEAVAGDQVEVSEMNYDGFDTVDNRWTNAADWSGFLY